MSDALDVLTNLMLGPASPGSHERFTVFLGWAERYCLNFEVDPAPFWTGLHENWPGCDDTWKGRDVFRDLVTQWVPFDGRHPCAFLTEDCDRNFFGALPDQLSVYRGCSMDRVMGLAWTTDRDVAAGFTRGHRGIEVPDPVLASATIPKGLIYGAYQSRNESEILVEPRRLRGVRVRHV